MSITHPSPCCSEGGVQQEHRKIELDSVESRSSEHKTGTMIQSTYVDFWIVCCRKFTLERVFEDDHS